MKGKISLAVLFVFLAFLLFRTNFPASADMNVIAGTKMTNQEEPNKLLIMYTTEEKEVFTKLVMPYALNSKRRGWWEEVNLLIWGPSNKLVASDEEVQDILKELKDAGVELTACLWCAEQYDLDEKLTELGVDVKYMGEPLTEMLKSGWKVLTF